MKFKKIIPKILLTVILTLICCIGVFRNICPDCENWEKAHENSDKICGMAITKYPLCGKQRPCA